MVDESIDDDVIFENYVDGEDNMLHNMEEINTVGNGDESGDDLGDVDIVDSDDDLHKNRLSDGEGGGSTHPVFNPVEMYNPTFELGMIFSTKKEFRQAVQSHAILTKRTLKFAKNDKIRVYAVCTGEDCQWKITAIKDQAYRAKRQALKKLERGPKYQYTRLWDYAEELRKTNLGSTVILGIENENGEVRFNRLYVCFNALKQGFASGCRPIIGVDGCHLKGPYGGVLLTAVGIDPISNIYAHQLGVAVVRHTCTTRGGLKEIGD
ncbi:UNVERIFIED_CONTAM: hypothetical protein Sradi_0294100 [Sesamum radiatum]|uniref:Transposase MuDR plant domain-containing protein n=1 Tax=Sesamum radiatum TaxID=300843 RepID=A0AAW2W2P4_SESRA